MSPQGPWLLHRGAFSAAHGPSSLCVDLVNYLGCQGPTTAYPRRGRQWGGGGVGGRGGGGGCCSMAVRKRWSVRERERNHRRGLEGKIRLRKLQAGVRLWV